MGLERGPEGKPGSRSLKPVHVAMAQASLELRPGGAAKVRESFQARNDKAAGAGSKAHWACSS
jgi:hypothetical protein